MHLLQDDAASNSEQTLNENEERRVVAGRSELGVES